MAPLVWNNRFNPSIEILFIQRNKLTECLNLLHDEISKVSQRCAHINVLLEQFEQLCQMYFTSYEQLLKELNYPLATEQKKLYALFLKAISQFKIDNNQCNNAINPIDFVKLRFNFAANTNMETMVLCNIIKTNFS